MQSHLTRRAARLIVGVLGVAGCHPPSSAPPIAPGFRHLGDIHGESTPITWTCAGAVCPWGASQTGHAVVWPADAGPVDVRLSYTVSGAMYLPAVAANGATVTSETAPLRVYAGRPGDEPHRLLATVAPGKTFEVAGLAEHEVLSVQGDAPFRYRATLPPVHEPDRDARGRDMQATPAVWRCNLPRCSSPAWTGAVIAWPAGTALQSNGRYGDQSRSVFASDGAPLYPYMGPWAVGCKVTARAGVVQIIEWRRGSDTWREVWLYPGQSHTIEIGAPEDSAMIETYEGSPGFRVSVASCTPQPIPPS